MMKTKVLPIDKLRLPSVLFKYFDPDKRKISTLLDKKFYISSVKDFNDPFDCNIPTRYPEQDLTPENIYLKLVKMGKLKLPGQTETIINEYAFEAQRQNLLHDSYHLEKADENNFENLANRFGVTCLTPVYDDILMWSYYADSHKGFCVGYNSHELLKSGLFTSGGKVIYKNDFHIIPLFDADTEVEFVNMFFSKGKMWKHEKEYRLIHPFSKGRQRSIADTTINEIIFGCRFNTKDKLILADKIQKVFPHIIISEMKISKTEFKLEKFILSSPDYILDL